MTATIPLTSAAATIVSPGATALTFIFGIVVLGSTIGFYAGARRKMDLEQWTEAGRGFGMVFVWLLMAGEIYNAFTFLGVRGWASSKGGHALYILAYQTQLSMDVFFVLTS